MRSDAYNIKKSLSPSNFRVCAIIALCVLFIPILISCRKEPSVHESLKSSVPSPPDLSHCTRVEIQLLPSTLVFFCPVSMNHNLLSLDETKYLHSLEPIVAEDQEQIKALAHDVSLLPYKGPALGEIAIKNRIRFSCYQNGKRITSFTQIGNVIQTEDRHWFENIGLPSLAPFIEQTRRQIKTFELRADCGYNLDNLSGWWHLYLKDKNADPHPSKWCDAIMRFYLTTGRSEESLMRLFKCPSDGEGKCHYAMNPHCKPDSPPDMVLLFETKAGWNQHGGPELFTFDNHDPKGGCVLLNDGTVKFIRTEEELHSLRWK